MNYRITAAALAALCITVLLSAGCGDKQGRMSSDDAFATMETEENPDTASPEDQEKNRLYARAMALMQAVDVANNQVEELRTALEEKRNEYQTYRDTLSLSDKKATSEEKKHLSALEKEVTVLQTEYDTAVADANTLTEEAKIAVQEYMENFSERVEEFNEAYKAMKS